MRIGLVIESVGGGSARHVVDLARGLSIRGHDTQLFFSPIRADAKTLAEIDRLPFPVHPIPIRRSVGLADISAARALGRALRRSGPFDIVHSHSSKAGLVARMANVGKARRVYTPHAFRAMDPGLGGASRFAFNAVERAFGRWRTDALVLVSRGEFDFADRHRIASGKRSVIANGVQGGVTPDRAAARALLGAPEDAIVFGFIGRLSHQKAPERFVATMVEVLARHPDAFAVMLDDGEYPDAFTDVIRNTELSSRFISVRGQRAADYHAGFDVLMMTSRYEGLSYVLLESLAAGVPFITTDVDGVDDVIAGSCCGIVVRNGEEAVKGLTDAATRLASDPTTRALMAEAARARDGIMNGDRMVRETEALYLALLEGRQSGR